MMASTAEHDRKHVMDTIRSIQQSGKTPTFYDIVLKLQGVVDLAHCETAVKSLMEDGKVFSPIGLQDTTVIKLTKHGEHHH